MSIRRTLRSAAIVMCGVSTRPRQPTPNCMNCQWGLNSIDIQDTEKTTARCTAQGCKNSKDVYHNDQCIRLYTDYRDYNKEKKIES